jgi:hypothetical protein
MSTNINITIGNIDLVDAAKLQQSASRQQLIDREASILLEAELRRNLIAAGIRTNNINGLPTGQGAAGETIYGAHFSQPQIERRPTANRLRQELNLGHLWKFGDINRRITSTGVLSAVGGGAGSSLTSTDNLRSSQRDLLLGCGDGGQWRTFADIGTKDVPLLPGETYSGGIEGERQLQPTSPPSAFNFNTGMRQGGSPVSSDIRFFEVALPSGGGNFIYIYGFASIWSAFETSALYGVTAIYTAQPPDYGGVPDDWPFTGYQSPYYLGILLQTLPDRLQIFNQTAVSFTGYRGKQRRFAAYACNNSSIREINIPLGIQALLDQALPEPVDSSTAVQILDAALPEGTFVHSTYRLPNVTTPNFTGYGGLKIGVLDSSVYTPDVFRVINNYTPFTSSTNIKSLPTRLKAGIADRSDGAWAAFQDTSNSPQTPWLSNSYREGEPFYYALWPNKNEEPNPEVWDPNYAADWIDFNRPKRITGATLRLKENRVSRNGANDSNNFYGPDFYNEEELISVWDWDDPVYCRRMCIELGFSADDLAP